MECGNIILFDVSLSEQINSKNLEFTDYERQIMLSSQIRILINMVPSDLSDIFKNENDFDLFQPLQVLNGHTICDYFIKFPVDLKRKMQKLENKDGEVLLRPSYLENFLNEVNHEEKVYNYLEERDFIRERYEIMMDLHMTNPIERCFNFKTRMVDSIEMLLHH